MVDWVNTPGSIYCLNYMSGHLRLFTLRPREIQIICVRSIKKTARKIKEFGNAIQKTKNAQQENPDAKMKNNYASRNLGE